MYRTSKNRKQKTINDLHAVNRLKKQGIYGYGWVSTTSGKSGFTLIELLVVISIIALLVSILLPSLNKAKSLARMTKCTVQLRGLGTATALYMSDNNDSYPVIKDFYGVMGDGNPTYGAPTQNLPDFYITLDLVDSKEMFHCPDADETLKEIYGYDYVYNSWSANFRNDGKYPRTFTDVYETSHAVLINDYNFQHPQSSLVMNMLYLDWHVASMSAEDYQNDYGSNYDLWSRQGWYDMSSGI